MTRAGFSICSTARRRSNPSNNGETIDIVATCVPRVIGQVKDYIEGYREPKEDWEE